MGSVPNLHVAVFAFPFATHAVGLFALVRKLAIAAPEVSFSFFSTAQSNRKVFSGLKDDGTIHNLKSFDVADGLPEGSGFRGNPVDLFLAATPGNFKSVVCIAEAEVGRKVSCLLTDAFLWFAGEMADEMRVPWIPLWTANALSLLVHLDTDLIRQRMGINGCRNATLELIPGYPATHAANLAEGIIDGDLNSSISSMLHKMGNTLPRATAIAISCFEELDPVVMNVLKLRFKKLLNIGPPALICPPPLSDEHGCLEWLDKHKAASVVYISFGSVITLPPHELAVLAESLEESGFPFLWSFRGNVEDKLPKGFLERTSAHGKVVPWAPQLKILNHSSVGVFVTHCGWNSVSESIIGAVPMIGRPFFGDQRLNMWLVQDVWRTGLTIEGGEFTKIGTTNALKRILSSEEGKEMRTRIQVQKQAAMKAVEPNGSIAENFKVLVQLLALRKDNTVLHTPTTELGKYMTTNVSTRISNLVLDDWN